MYEDLDCQCHANTCRCTSRPTRPNISLELTGPTDGTIVASAGDVHQLLTRSAMWGPVLDNYDRALRTHDRGLAASLAASLRQVVRQKLQARNVKRLNTSLVASGLTTTQALAALTTDPASTDNLRAYNGAMRRGDVVTASGLAGLLRTRAANVWADVQAHERADAMDELERRVYATDPTKGDWMRLKRRAHRNNPNNTKGTQS